jgi:hypothetical protein
VQLEKRRGIWANNMLVRADVQFLRQDFSITFPFKPVFGSMQGFRFDFVVRTRQLKGEELRDWKKQEVANAKTFPQRNAALFALRSLTGQDAGPTTEAWVKLYPHADAEAEGLRMSEALKRAAYEQRDHLLAKYRDGKDDGYSEGLAHAIPRLTGKLRDKTREALVVRLSRMSVDKIRDYLEDDDEELRRAACLACIRKADPKSVPDLIGLLLDADPAVTEGARKALQCLTDEDFGPAPDAEPDARLAAVARWHDWFRRNAGADAE